MAKSNLPFWTRVARGSGINGGIGLLGGGLIAGGIYNSFSDDPNSHGGAAIGLGAGVLLGRAIYNNPQGTLSGLAQSAKTAWKGSSILTGGIKAGVTAGSTSFMADMSASKLAKKKIIDSLPREDRVAGSRRAGHDYRGKYTNEWGHNSKEYGAKFNKNGKLNKGFMSKEQMQARTRSFAFGGTGYKREALANSFGVLTKKQWARAPMFEKLLIPGVAALNIYDAMKSDSPISGLIDTAAMHAIGAPAFRIGQSIGMSWMRGAAGEAGIGFLGRGIAGAMGLGLAGVAVGAAMALDEGIKATGDSNNLIRRSAESIKAADFKSHFEVTDEGLTMRQRALQKLSKSGLNHRATTLGNESSVLFG